MNMNMNMNMNTSTLLRRLAATRVAVAVAVLGLLLAGNATAARAGGVTSTQAISYLNAQRAANGIPADITDNTAWDTGCRHHIAWEGENPNAPNPHIETPGTPGYTDDGAAAGASAVLASGDDWNQTNEYPWGATNPWESAPIHLMQLLAPDLNTTGWWDNGYSICMITWDGYGRPTPATPQLLTYPGSGTSFIYPSEQANEWPFTPADFVGLPEGGTTGPYVYVFGWGTGPGAITAASLTGPDGPVPVRTVDNTTSNARGDLGSYLPSGGIIIPVSPLRAGTSYTANVTFAPSSSSYGYGPQRSPLSLTWQFRTQLADPGIEVGADEEGGAGIAVASDSPARVMVTLSFRKGNRVAWTSYVQPGSATRPRLIGLPERLRGTYRLCASQPASGIYSNAQSCAGLVYVHEPVVEDPTYGFDSFSARFVGNRLRLTLRVSPSWRGASYSYRVCSQAVGSSGRIRCGSRTTTTARSVIVITAPIPDANHLLQVYGTIRLGRSWATTTAVDWQLPSMS